GIVGDVAVFRVAGGLHVGTQETWEGDGAAGGGALGLLTGACLSCDGHLHGGALRIRHLGGDGALPDQPIDPAPLRVELYVQRTRGGEAFSGGTDRLVRLL